MSSREFTGPVHLAAGARNPASARDRVRFASISTVWLGLCWGLCAPLIVVVDPSSLARAWLVTVPAGLAAFVLAERALARRLAQPGRAAEILEPGWLVGLSPLVLLLPARSLPVMLVCMAAAVMGYRAIALLRAGAPEASPRGLEVALLVGVFLGGFVALFDVHVVHDAFQYYGYLVSMALDGDLNLYDQIYLHNAERFYNPFPRESARYIGTALFETPFFLLGHVVAVLRHAGGHPLPAIGYGTPYGFGITLGSSLFGLGGMVATYRLVVGFFARRVAMIAVLAVVFASPLVYFMYVWGGWAHPIAFCLVASFLLLWQRTRGARSWTGWAALGALAGIIALVRPTAAVVVVFPALEWAASLRERRAGFARGPAFGGPAVAAVAALAAFSPQLAIWRAVSGRWIAAPYREVGDFHDWAHPDFGGLLFSTAQHGLFAWTPLMLLAALGIATLYRRDRLLALGSALMVVGTLYLYACWSIWWTGIGFSNRFSIELTPLFALGLAGLFDLARRRITVEGSVALLALAVSWNLFLVGAYRANDIPQGIPDPHRVVDEPLTFTGLATHALQLTPDRSTPRWFGWGRDGFFTGRMLRAIDYRDARTGVLLIVLLGSAFLPAVLLSRRLLREASPVGARAGPLRFLVGLSIAVLALHGAIAAASGRTRPSGRFHLLPDSGITLQWPAADTWVYSDYHQPVTSVDLLSGLTYGHGIDQGEAVATITLYDSNGREFERVLRAGVDTAEGSYPRQEYRDAIRHGVAATEVVRARPAGVYSRRDWETLTFRAVIDLPEPVVVRKIRLRYIHPVGRLVVSDIFLRDFR